MLGMADLDTPASIYWLRDPAPAGTADPPLDPGEQLEVDVAIIGGGYTGLWSAIALTDTDPSLRVVVLEQATVAFGASGRNGGFCQASLTHGISNGIKHFPEELERLEREGADNLRGLIDFTRAHGIDCDLEEVGGITFADQPYQVEEFRAWAEEGAEVGEDARVLGSRPRLRGGPLAALAGRACTRHRGATSCSIRPSCAGASPGSRASVASGSMSTPG